MEWCIYTSLVECENYKDFESMISDGSSVSLGYFPKEDYYAISNYSDTFKGFDYDSYYVPVTNAAFLCRVAHSSLVDFLIPEFDVKTKTVTFFENLDKREKGVRSNPTKMGKFFRKIAPFFNDKQIEFLVNYTVDYFTENVYEHNIAKGDEITEIYLSKAEKGRNLGNYSCIHASCMRHSDWDIHPTKVYATESWELHYLTNKDGDIAARALVCKEDDVYSYIYASCEHSGNALKEKLKESGFTNAEVMDEPFDGAKLLRIEGNGGLVAPYIDYHCEVKDHGGYLELTYGYADYSFNSLSGCVGYNTAHECAECYCEVREDDVISIDGVTYCFDCTFYCNHFNEHAVGKSFEVFYSNCGSDTVCEDALEDMGAVFNEEENEWQTAEWFAECTKEDEEDTEIQIHPKKEITPGVDCVVISGYGVTHYFPIGTVVKVMSKFYENVWDCHSFELCFSQNVEAKDLVIVE
mgnify:FL=1